MARVSLVKCESYHDLELDSALRRAVDLVGGLRELVRPGDRVLIKPNMLSGHPPVRRITTDPALVTAVARLVMEAGGKPLIGDSPALDGFQKTAVKTGLAAAAEAVGANLVELKNPVRISPEHPLRFRNLELSSICLEADVVINLPKLKTHSQMLLTLGVKNLFGTVVAQRKAEWHAMIGVDRDHFATLLLDIYRTVAPALTILDGVWGMEGRGPANGQPRQVGLLAASTDALAMDLTVARLLQAPLEFFPLYRAARKFGLVDQSPNAIELTGDLPQELIVPDFVFPKLGGINVLPGRLGRIASRHLSSKPNQTPAACIACRKCIDICASQAIQLQDRRLRFDYDRCIRCYCCQEVCPQNAIGFTHGPLVRLLHRFGR